MRIAVPLDKTVLVPLATMALVCTTELVQQMVLFKGKCVGEERWRQMYTDMDKRF